MRIHSVFHVFKFLPVPINSFSEQVQLPAQPIKIKEDISWEVEKIFDSKHVQKNYV